MKPAEFHLIDMETWPRRDHYEYYKNLVQTCYNLTANVDITHILKFCDRREIKFYPAFIYAITKAVNEVPEFRMAYDKEGNLGWYDYLNPSYTIFHKDDSTFSDVWSPWKDTFVDFYQEMLQDMENAEHSKGIKAKPDKPNNFFPVSGVPWVTFTGYACDTFRSPHMLFAIATFGKYFEAQEIPDCIGRTHFANTKSLTNPRTLIPVNVFVPHMVADGYHTCQFFRKLQNICDNAADWLIINEKKGWFR